MDPKTIDHYDRKAPEIAAAYNAIGVEPLHALLRRWLPCPGRVLEIGCGSGRDAAFMASIPGIEVVATDASEQLIAQALSSFGTSGSSAFQGNNVESARIQFVQTAFPLFAGHDLLRERFDAVVAIAVLMHIPEHELFDFAWQARSLLKPGGIFICSVCSGRPPDPSDPRLYIDRHSDEIQLLLERLGFRLLHAEETPDGMGRPMQWTTMVFGHVLAVELRPVDQIESIINRDSKTATYKLALLRALCDIAQTSCHHAIWHENNRVSIPLGLVVEKWLNYYWPIIESPLGLPEMRVGSRASGLAFRPLLNHLINQFSQGGLNAFHALFQSGRLDQAQAVLVGAVATQIAQTIVKGPVRYSGSCAGEPERLFTFEGNLNIRSCSTPSDLIRGFGRIAFPSGVWRELCLVGHWIGEAIILRWAELSRDFSHMRVEMADILALLLIHPESERAVEDAKRVYRNQQELHCVWSGRILSPARFDVDHVIPFSIWHNNELWNLLPSDPRINRMKRDRIVTRDILRGCRDNLIHYWRILDGAEPMRFRNEMSRTLLGRFAGVANWEIPAFSALSEAVETVARQRGVERWEMKVEKTSCSLVDGYPI